jgi:signal transduction histidine kinase/ActR/RegA family two-component response regulator
VSDLAHPTEVMPNATPRATSVRSHLILIILAVLIPLLLFSVWLVRALSVKEQEALIQGLRETARAAAIAVQKEMSTHIGALETLAASRALDDGDLIAFREQALRVVEGQRRHHWLAVVVADPSGQEVLSTLTPTETPRPATADMSGFREVLATRRPAVRDVTSGSPPGPMEFGVRVPVERGDELRYVLTALIGIEAMGEVVSALRIPVPSVCTILDSKHIIVARSRNADQFVGKPAPPRYVAASRAADEGTFTYDTMEGEAVHAAYSRVPDTGWTVGLGAPVTLLASSRRTSLLLLGGAGLLLLGLGVVLAALTGRRFTRSIASISAAARALGQGDPPRLPPSGIDEVDRAGRALVEAADLLRDREEALRSARAEAVRSADRLRHLQAVTEIALGPRTANEVLHDILQRVRKALGANTATLLLLDAEGQHLVPAHSVGLTEEIELGVKVAVGQGVSGKIGDSPRGLIVPDLKDEAVVSPVLRSRVQSLVGVPLRSGPRFLGVLHVGSAQLDAFTSDDLDLLRLIADRIVLAIERSRLLETERLARQEAESASRTKDEFLAVLSHELRTPLNAVYGWARMLQSRRLGETEAARALDAIVRNADAQVQLIDDLLDVSRIVTGKMRLDVREVSLDTVIEAALDAVRPAAEAKSIRLQPVLHPLPGPVTGDPARLQQVIWNLLINAVKFTPQGGRVQVSLREVDSHVEIAVSDTGQGIPPALLPLIFERFRQVDSSTTRTVGGLGVGLALVRHLVELHGGSVAADSAGEGQGATFTVKLPLAASRLLATPGSRGELAAVRSAASGMPAAALRGVRTLVVDDDRDALDLVSVVLAGAGADVRTCASAEEAMAAWREWRPDVLLSDIQMPGEDGYSLIRRVRAEESDDGGRVPAVALTAYGRVEDRMRALSAGFSMHLPKPVDPIELVTVVASLVEPRPSRGSQR